MRFPTIYKSHYLSLIRLGFPIMVGQLGIIVLGFADTLMIGHHSTPELGAASFVNNLFTLCIIFCTGFSSGLTPVVGQFHGQHKSAEAGRALQCGIIANLAVSLLLMSVMGLVYLNIERLGQPEELIPVIKPYYLTLLSTLPFIMLFNAFKQFTDGITDTQTAMWILLGGNALNIAGNYLLIYGKCGFPELGLSGAGISTLAARIIMVLVFICTLFFSHRFTSYLPGVFCRKWSSALFHRLNALGWPIALQMGLEAGYFTLSAIMVGWIGTTALASHQIMITISQVPFMMYCGMGMAIAIRISHFKGQNDLPNVHRSAYAGFHLIVCMGILLLSVVFILKDQLGSWFTSSAEVSCMVSSLFFPFLLYQFGDGLQITFSNALRGVADVRPMMYIALIAYFLISLPFGYLFGFTLDWGIYGIWMAFPIGLTFAGALFFWRFKKRHANEEKSGAEMQSGNSFFNHPRQRNGSGGTLLSIICLLL